MLDEKMTAYQRLVAEYANVLDLTSPRLLDDFSVGLRRSLDFVDLLEPQTRVLDVGSGVGLPGIPIALARPDLEVLLCEVRLKRAAFLERATSQLGLMNVTVYNANVQNLSERVDVVTALWVGSLQKLFSLTRHLFGAQWTIVTRKGDNYPLELEQLRSKAQVEMFHVKPLSDGANLVLVRGRQ